jgi:ribosomal-protein-alanine N-acetyltransferase
VTLVRRATPDDLEAIGRIQEASPEAARWIPAEYLVYDCWVAEAGGKVAGFLVSRKAGEEREILNLAVEPASRRRGLARALVLHELASGGRAWFLEVRESNAEARRLYANCGFRETGVRAGYYDGPAEDAVVMSFFS